MGGENYHTLSIPELPSHAHSLYNTFSGNINFLNFYCPSVRYYLGHTDDSDDGNDIGFTVVSATELNIRQYNPSSNFTLTLSGDTVSTGNNYAHENRPPYYALYYIMKIK